MQLSNYRVDAMYEVPSKSEKKFIVDAAYAASQLEKAHFERTRLSD